jgi:hypothetical protein
MINSITNIFAYCFIPLIASFLIFLALKLFDRSPHTRNNEPKGCEGEKYLERQSTPSDYDFLEPFTNDAPTDNIKSVHVDSAGFIHVEWQ